MAAATFVEREFPEEGIPSPPFYFPNLEEPFSKETVEESGHQEQQTIKQASPANNASSSEVEYNEPKSSPWRRFCVWFSGLPDSWPRLYDFTFVVVLPLLFIVAVCFFCGWITVLLEADTQMKNNDAFIANRFNYTVIVHLLAEQVMTAPTTCMKSFEQDLTEETLDDYKQHLETCQEELSIAINATRDDIVSDMFTQQDFDIDFGWILCPANATDYDSLTKYVVNEWQKSFLSLIGINTTIQDDKQAVKVDILNAVRDDNFEEVLMNATGHANCYNHVPGGALYWFVFMTTIGYGNVYPLTWGGRAFVFTIGFLSILLWGVIITKAAQTCLIIMDDLWLGFHPTKRLATGWHAWLLWLIFFYLWLLVMSVIVLAWGEDRVNGVEESEHPAAAYWFSFITVTTVGLGDLYISSNMIRTGDLLYLPFLFLSGFIVLANFLLKLSDWVVSFKDPNKPTLEDKLAARRQEREKKKNDQGQDDGESSDP